MRTFICAALMLASAACLADSSSTAPQFSVGASPVDAVYSSPVNAGVSATRTTLIFTRAALQQRKNQHSIVGGRAILHVTIERACLGKSNDGTQQLVYYPKTNQCLSWTELNGKERFDLAVENTFNAAQNATQFAAKNNAGSAIDKFSAQKLPAQWRWLIPEEKGPSCSCATSLQPLASNQSSGSQAINFGQPVAPVSFSAFDPNFGALTGTFQWSIDGGQINPGLPNGLAESCNTTDNNIECTLNGTPLVTGELLLTFSASNGQYAGNASANVTITGTPGSISGTLSRDSDGSGVGPALMILYDPNQGSQEVATLETALDGTYQFDNLLPSNYTVAVFNLSAFGLIAELYDDIPCPDGCDPAIGTLISVASGQQVQNIDISVAAAGSIAGRLTRADNGLPIIDSVVNTYRVNANGTLASTGIGFTDNNGDYLVSGLQAGNYKVGLEQLYDFQVQNNDNLLSEVYNDQACPCIWANGDSVAVTEGATTPNINFVLETAPFSVTGRVTNEADGMPIVGVEMQIQDKDLAQLDEPVIVVASKKLTDANGEFSFQVPSGNYVVRTDAAALGFVDEWYDNQPIDVDFDTIAPLVINANRSNVDFALASGSAIEGRVTRSVDGSPVGTFLVSADNLDDARSFAVETNADGQYSLSGITPGTYRVSTFSGPGFNLINEVYDDIACANCDIVNGTPVVVTLGQPTTGIDFVLDTGGSISGSVVADETDIPLPGVLVFFFDDQGENAGQAFVAANGSFVRQGLMPGDYRVLTTRAGQFSLINEIFDDLPCVGACNVLAGQAITVNAGDLIQNVDIRLSPVPEVGTSAPASEDDTGNVVVIVGNQVLIGVPGDDSAGQDAGLVVIFENDVNGDPQAIGLLQPLNAQAGDLFGSAMAASGNTVVVGAPGRDAAFVFDLATDMASSNSEISMLAPVNLSNVSQSGFATSVAIEGNTIAVGAPMGQKSMIDAAGGISGTDSGAVVLYTRNGINIVSTGVLTDEAGSSGDEFGISIAITDGTISVGSPGRDGSGAVLVFPPIANKIVGLPSLVRGAQTATGDRFGQAIASLRGRLIVGAPAHDEAASDAGAVHVFDTSGPSVAEEPRVLPRDPTVDASLPAALLGAANGRFGSSLSFGQRTLAVGADNEHGESDNAGAAYVFTREQPSPMSPTPTRLWSLSDRIVRRGGQTGDQLGKSVAVIDGRIAIGAPKAVRQSVDSGTVLTASSAEAVFGDVLFSDGFE